jgi:pimeloyl-ACP methyl ester carboxylesterase
MPDARVRAAVEHWAPRFISMGVDYNDFVRTTRRIERWEQWLDAWSQTAEEHLELAAQAERAGHPLSAGEAYLSAAVCLHFAKFVWVLDVDRHWATVQRAIAALARAHRYLDPSAQRIEAPLDGARLAANLRRPPGPERAPLVILIPGLDSTKEEFFHLENVFLARGLATLSMDGPGQGETGSALPIRPDYEVALAAMLDTLEGREDVDLERVGVVGVSLGGYYGARAAAFEPRIRAVVGVSSPFDLGGTWETLPSVSQETFTAKSGARDQQEARARAGELNLAGVVSRMTQPALFITGRLDRIIPWEQTQRTAHEAPNARFVLFDEGTHVCNNMPYRYRPLAADWIHDHLLGRPVEAE